MEEKVIQSPAYNYFTVIEIVFTVTEQLFNVIEQKSWKTCELYKKCSAVERDSEKK